jgi:chitin disaccharide deacetylase
MRRVLVVNADDFGRSPGINRGIARAHEEGIVTNASLMVRYPAAEEAARYAAEHAELGIGLHVDLGEWSYRDEEWRAVYEFPASDGDTVAAEVRRQLEEFRRIVGSDPTHLDSHQHVHREEPVLGVMQELASRLGVPLRSFGADVSYCGSFYGQTSEGDSCADAISVEGLVGIIGELREGITELGCHPGVGSDYESSYVDEREREVETLCDPRVRAALRDEGIKLMSFRDALS